MTKKGNPTLIKLTLIIELFLTKFYLKITKCLFNLYTSDRASSVIRKCSPNPCINAQ